MFFPYIQIWIYEKKHHINIILYDLYIQNLFFIIFKANRITVTSFFYHYTVIFVLDELNILNLLILSFATILVLFLSNINVLLFLNDNVVFTSSLPRLHIVYQKMFTNIWCLSFNITTILSRLLEILLFSLFVD